LKKREASCAGKPLSQREEPIRQRGIPQIGRAEFDIGPVVLIVGRGQLRLIDVAAYSS
jgi:hypothetical protein